MLLDTGPNLVDPRGRLLPRSYDVLGDAPILFLCMHNSIKLECIDIIFLSSCSCGTPFTGLYTTFVFQKPDPDIGPPLTPLLQDGSHNHDEASLYNYMKAMRVYFHAYSGKIK